MKWQVNRNGKTEYITVRRPGLFKAQEIWLGDEYLGKWPAGALLSNGATFTAKDGSKLEMQMKTFPGIEVIIKFNGEIVPGTAGHPETRINNAYMLMGLICALHLIFGYFAIFWNFRILQNLGFGPYNLATGSVFLGLFLWGRKDKKFWPLLIGLVIFFIDTILMVKLLLQLQVNPGPGPLIIRIMLAIPWINGIREAYKIKRTE